MSKRITVIGDGAMATVCGSILASKSCTVRLWSREPQLAAAINTQRQNSKYLPRIDLPATLSAHNDPATAFFHADGLPDLLVSAVPTQFLRPVLQTLLPHIPPAVPVLSVTKGIEVSTLQRPTQILASLLGPRPLVVLSGPNIATEIARKLPATAVLASQDEPLARTLQDLMTTPYFRLYTNDDPLGVELAGALKNVIAVAAGILDGMNAGYNCKSAMLTRGLVEITRLGIALGAKPETFAGLAGMGDLVTTCFSPEGRNRSFGEQVGKGRTPREVLEQMVGVVEGVATTQSVVALAGRMKVEMPITQGLYRVLFENLDPWKGIAELMTREPKAEGI